MILFSLLSIFKLVKLSKPFKVFGPANYMYIMFVFSMLQIILTSLRSKTQSLWIKIIETFGQTELAMYCTRKLDYIELKTRWCHKNRKSGKNHFHQTLSALVFMLSGLFKLKN